MSLSPSRRSRGSSPGAGGPSPAVKPAASCGSLRRPHLGHAWAPDELVIRPGPQRGLPGPGLGRPMRAGAAGAPGQERMERASGRPRGACSLLATTLGPLRCSRDGPRDLWPRARFAVVPASQPCSFPTQVLPCPRRGAEGSGESQVQAVKLSLRSAKEELYKA